MKIAINQTVKTFWKANFLSPNYLLVRAGGLVLLFLVAHAFGLRDYTTFVSGTTAHPEVSMRMTAYYGMTYLVLYFGCVVFAPIMIIAAGILKIVSGMYEKNCRQDVQD